MWEKAEAIAAALGQPVKELFTMTKDGKPLANKTILEHHRFIHTVLDQAEREMLVPYNAASKASPPSVARKEPNYFQPETVTAFLDALEDEPEKWRVITHGDRWQNTGYLFTQDDGRPINPTSITAWLNKFSARQDLPHINPHAFRHSVASILISAGIDIVTVSKQLGHSQVSTTGDIYSHIIEEAKAQATECIADVMLRRKRA